MPVSINHTLFEMEQSIINMYVANYSMCIIKYAKISPQEVLIRVGNYSKLIMLTVEKAFLNITLISSLICQHQTVPSGIVNTFIRISISSN